MNQSLLNPHMLPVPLEKAYRLLNHGPTVLVSSQYDAPEKLRQCGVELFQFGHSPIPVVEGCSAWILCELIPEPHNQQQHDLFIGKVIAAYADDRVFRDGHWYYHEAADEWKSIHHVAGGHFYTIGDAVDINQLKDTD